MIINFEQNNQTFFVHMCQAPVFTTRILSNAVYFKRLFGCKYTPSVHVKCQVYFRLTFDFESFMLQNSMRKFLSIAYSTHKPIKAILKHHSKLPRELMVN